MRKPFVYPQNARSAEYRTKLEYIDSLGIDVFEEQYLSDPRFDVKNIVLKTNHWSVFTTQHEYNNVEYQFIFVSKENVETLWELSPAAFINLKSTMKKICKNHEISGGGFISRFGDPQKSGATVKHLHLQLLVPKDNCAISTWFGSQNNT